MVTPGVVAGERAVGRGSPRRGSRKRDPEKETEIDRAHKNPQQQISLKKSIQYIYETPEILRSIFSTGSCPQSDNDVSTSNRSCKIFPHKSINEHTSFGTTLDSTGENLINQVEGGIILLIFAERRSLNLSTATSAMFDQRPARHHCQSCHSHHVSNVKIFESCH